MSEYSFYEFDKVMVTLPEEIYRHFTIYKYGKKIEINAQDIKYKNIIKIDLPFSFRDGDIFRLKDDLIFVLYDFDKNEFIVKNYLTNEKFCNLKQLNKRIKNKYGNIYGDEYSLRAGLFYDSIVNLLHENYIEESIKIILKMPRVHFFDTESWNYFRIKLIKRLYEINLQSDNMRRMIYDLMTDSLENFLDNDLNSEQINDERKISILESYYK